MPRSPRPLGDTASSVPWLQRVVGRLRSPSEDAPSALIPALAVLDAIPDPFIVVDAADRVRALNAAAVEAFGYAEDAVVGEPLADALIAPDDRDAYRALCTSRASSAVVRAVHADGTGVRVDVSVRPVPTSGGPVFGVCLREPLGDPSETAQALAAAEGRQRVLRTVVDTLPDPVVAVDRVGQVVLRNRADLQAIGDAPPEHALDPDQWTAAQAVMEAGEPVYDREEPGPDGATLATTRVPVRDRAGAVVGLVAISRDVTAQKAAEAQILHDKRAAEAAAQGYSDVLATTSHEIRTLLNGVTGMTALLLETDLSDEQHAFVDTVRTSSDALLGVINDVLDFSKIEAGLLAIDDREYDVRRVTEEALRMVAQQASTKGLRLSRAIGENVPATVRGDAGRVRQVLVNLLSNAVKFTNEGTVRLRVGWAPPNQGHPAALTFAVEDTGVGIAPDRLEAVFERFTQADDQTAQTHGGTGLGLAICRRLATLMGGELTADSALGVGSVFRFQIPLGAQAAATAAPSGPATETLVAPSDAPVPASPVDAASAGEFLSSARVLLAEDNPINQQVAVLMLRRLGYKPDVVENGAEAVRAVRSEPYDVVIMDMMMPVMGGLEATQTIREDAGPHPGPAIVALTANVMDGDRERCLDAGCDDYLAKPVAPADLAATIERALRTRAEALAAA